MKVRCIANLDAAGRPSAKSSWLRIGREYQVLALEIEAGRTKLRLIGENPTAALFGIVEFEVTSGIISPTWVVTSQAAGQLTFQPEAWAADGFWERYFDGDPAAIAEFNAERAKIIAADP